MVNSVDTHNLAVRIYDALNKKGAGLGNASIGIIESAIEESAQQSSEPTRSSAAAGEDFGYMLSQQIKKD